MQRLEILPGRRNDGHFHKFNSEASFGIMLGFPAPLLVSADFRFDVKIISYITNR